jgi:hypothetical protein
MHFNVTQTQDANNKDYHNINKQYNKTKNPFTHHKQSFQRNLDFFDQFSNLQINIIAIATAKQAKANYQQLNILSCQFMRCDAMP